MQRLSRFARYWDLIINSGRFANTKKLILSNNAFYDFLALSDWIFETTGQTHKISLERLYALLYQGLIEKLTFNGNTVRSSLLSDYEVSGIKGLPKFLRNDTLGNNAKRIKSNQRQVRHSAL